MNFHISEENRLKIKLIATVTGVLMGFYFFFRYIFIAIWPIAISFLLAMLIYPMVRFFHRKLKIGTKTGTVLIVIVLTAGFLYGLGFLMQKIAGQIELLIQNYDIYEEKVMGTTKDVCCFFEDFFGMKNGCIYRFLAEEMQGLTDGIQKKLLRLLIGTSLPAIRFFVDFLIAGAIMVVAFFLFIKDMEGIRAGAKKSVFHKELAFIYLRCVVVGKAYVKAQLIIMCIVAACSVAGLFVAKNPYPWLLGILVGVLDALPFLGSGLILIPLILFSLMEKNFFAAAVLFTTFIICYFVREYLEPKLMGDKMGVSPVLTLIGIYAGYQFFGFPGMIAGSLAVIFLSDVLKQVKNGGCL